MNDLPQQFPLGTTFTEEYDDMLTREHVVRKYREETTGRVLTSEERMPILGAHLTITVGAVEAWRTKGLAMSGPLTVIDAALGFFRYSDRIKIDQLAVVEKG
jgi:hypothetical protein